MKLSWDITNKCNLRCKHCAAISLLEQDKAEYKDWKKVIDYVSGFVDSISLLGGEPLLHPEIEELIKYANSKGIKILIITNGQADSNIINAIMKQDIQSILVSFEGLEEAHDMVRGKGTWKKAIETLKLLTTLNKTAETQVGVNIVANKLNRKEIISFIEATKHMNIAYQISALSLKGNAQANRDILEISTQEILDLFEELSEYNVLNPHIKINILNNYPVLKSYLNKKFGTSYNVKGFTCDALSGSIYADPYGNICICQNHSDVRINIEDSNGWVEDFPKFEPFLRLLHTRNENNVCTVCSYKEVCIPCPFNTTSQLPELCAEVIKRTNSLPLPLNARFKLNKPYAIIESDNRHEVFYPNLGINTEYTSEGIRILKAIKEFKTLKDISDEVSFPPEIVYEFLTQEKKSSKVIEAREQLIS